MKANRFLFATLFAATFLLTTAFSSVSVMANTVQVFLDGTRLEFEDVQPQIINDRTMVPLRAVAAHFGMEATWDEPTATMVFTAPGRTMIHTVHTNIIIVNGQVIPFPEPGMNSMIANDRTLMPIRMLAEAIGHDVDWDESTRTVDIWTDGPAQNIAQPPSQLPTPPTTPATPATGNITVFSATVNRLNHEYGEPVVIRVATNNAADRVRVVDSNNNELALADEFTYDSQGRYFDVSVVPTEQGEVRLEVFAGNAAGFVFSPQTIMVNVVPPVPEITANITNVRLSGRGTDRNRFDTNEHVAGTFRTTPDVVRIRIEDSAGRQVDQTNRYMSSTPVFRTWEFDFNSPTRNGTYTFYIVAFDRDNNEDRITFEIVVGTGTDTTTNQQTAGHSINVNLTEVISVTVYNRDGANNDVRTGERVRMTVVTDLDVDEVEISHIENQWVAGSRTFTTSGSQRTFQLEFTADHPDANYSLRILDNWGWNEARLSNFSVRN